MVKKPDTKKLLEVRKRIKSKKPEFLQQDYHKKSRLARKWKRPTGLQSKMRHQLKGYRRRVKQGWRSPLSIRGFDARGYQPIIVSNVKDLNNIKEDQAIIISKTVGLKNKIVILEKAAQLNIVALNLKLDVLKKKSEDLKAKNIEGRKNKQEKKKSLDDALKKADKKKKDDSAAESGAEVTADEKKADEKKEKDEVLIHKQ